MAGRTPTIGLVLLCVLAGCNAFGGQGATASEETVTPAPVPTVETEPAEGVSEDGIDAPAVAANHRTALIDRSYTTQSRIRWQDANGTTYTETTVHRVGPGGERYHIRAEYGHHQRAINVTGYELWHDENRTLLRVEPHASEEKYQELEPESVVRDPNQIVQYPRMRTVRKLFARLEPREVTQTQDGGTVVRGSLETIDGFRGLSRFHSERNATMAARITPAGYVDRISVSFDATFEGEPVDVRMSTEFTKVGSTNVTEPGWIVSGSIRSPSPSPND